MVPGMKALKEIKFYQRCQTFLVPQLPFSHLVREICEEIRESEDISTVPLCWQAIALFALQTSSEAYMAGFFLDVNLCALHRKVVTIDRKDVWLAVQIWGREQVGGRANVSDTGMQNTTDWMSMDPSEKHGHKDKIKKGQRFPYITTPNQEWNDALLDAARLKTPVARKGQGKGKKTLIKDILWGITKSAICRLAHRGGVKRMTGHIYDLSRGVLKLFLKAVIQDAMIYTVHCKRRTVTVMDVIYSLKNHGHHLYGFVPRNY